MQDCSISSVLTVETLQPCIKLSIAYYKETLCCAGHQLRYLDMGVTDVTPRHQEPMTPGDFNVTLCSHITGPLITSTVRCPEEGVTGRYLVIQRSVSDTDDLWLCEVEVNSCKSWACYQIRKIADITRHGQNSHWHAIMNNIQYNKQ